MELNLEYFHHWDFHICSVDIFAWQGFSPFNSRASIRGANECSGNIDFLPGAFSLSKEWTRVTLLAIKFIEV